MRNLLKWNKLFLFIIAFILIVQTSGYPAVYFNGGEYLLWVDTAGMNNGETSYALSVTFRPSDVDYSTSATWGQPVWFLGDPLLLNITLTKDGYPQLRWYMATGSWDYITGPDVLSDNTLYTIVGVWQQNNTTSLYVNGALVASKTASNYNINHAAAAGYNTNLGSYSSKTYDYGVDDTAFRGVIYEACAWNAGLTAQDAINLSAGLAGTCWDVNPTELVIYLPLEDYPAETLTNTNYYYNKEYNRTNQQARAFYCRGGTVIKSVADEVLTHK